MPDSNNNLKFLTIYKPLSKLSQTKAQRTDFICHSKKWRLHHIYQIIVAYKPKISDKLTK